MPIVSNSSPLIVYAAIGRLDLLGAVFARIYVPEAVSREVIVAGAGRPGAREVRAAPWITTRPVTGQGLLQSLSMELDAGEAEVLALALELGRLPVLLDDRQGRRLARMHEVPLLGSAGALLEAKRQGLLPLIRPTLDQLRSAGLYLDESVYRHLLARAGE